MPRYCAQVDAVSVVARVVVAPSVDWCADNLGGTWAETADPYTAADVVAYCGPGWGFDARFPERFAPVWRQPAGSGTSAPPYAEGVLVFHAGRIWRSTVDANVWEPGVSGWQDSPAQGLPVWVQPTGAHDAYPTGAEVTHNGQDWRSTVDANVWEPGVFGWAVI